MGNVLCVPNRNKDVASGESVPDRRRGGVRHWITHRILGRRSNAVAPLPVHSEDGCISAGTDKSGVGTPSGVVVYSQDASSSNPSPSCSLDNITSLEIQEISTTDVVAPSYITIATSSAVTIAANTATQMATTSAPHTIVQLLNPSSAVASSLSGPFPVASESKPSEVAQYSHLPNAITTCTHVLTSCVATAAMSASFSRSFHSPTMASSSTMSTSSTAYSPTLASSSPSTTSASSAANLTTIVSSSTVSTSTAASLRTMVSSSTMSTSSVASLTTMVSSSTVSTSTAANLATMASSSTAANLATMVSSSTMPTSSVASLTTVVSSSTMPTSTAASLTTMVSSSTMPTSTATYLATMASSPTLSTSSTAHSATMAAPAITASAVFPTSTTPTIPAYATENAVMIPNTPAISQHVLHPTVSVYMHPPDVLTTASTKATCIAPSDTGSGTEHTKNEEICQVNSGVLAANTKAPGEKDTTKQMEPADKITSIENNGHTTDSRLVLQTYPHKLIASPPAPNISATIEVPEMVVNKKVYDDESKSCKDKIDDELGHADIDDIDEPDEDEVKTTTHEEIIESWKATDKLANSKVKLDDSVKAPEEPPKEIPFNPKSLENLLVAISKINKKYSQNSTPENCVAGAEINYTTIPNDNDKVKETPIQAEENKTTVDMKNANTGDRPVKASGSSKSNDGLTLTQDKRRTGVESLCKEAAQRNNKPKILYKRSSQQTSSNRYGKGSSRGGIKLTKKKLGNFKGPKQPHSRPPPMTQYRKPHINKISDVAKAEAKENITWTQTETQSLDGQQFWSNRAPMFEPPVLTLGEGLLARYGSVDRMKRCSVVPQCRQIETLKLEHSVLPGLRVKPNMRGCYNIDSKKHGQNRAQGFDKTKTKTKSQGPKVMMQRPPTRHGGRLSRWSKYIDLSKVEGQTDPDASNQK